MIHDHIWGKVYWFGKRSSHMIIFFQSMYLKFHFKKSWDLFMAPTQVRNKFKLFIASANNLSTTDGSTEEPLPKMKKFVVEEKKSSGCVKQLQRILFWGKKKIQFSILAGNKKHQTKERKRSENDESRVYKFSVPVF